jgi:Family of unknown function (DUF6603)
MTTALAWTVLRPLVDAARQRLQAAVDQGLTPDAARTALLTEVLGAAPTAADAAAAGTRLPEIEAALADLAVVVARPPDAAAARDAALALTSALLATGRLVDAAAGVAPGTVLSTNAQRVLIRLLGPRSAPGAAGLLAQLGLAGAPELVFEADRVTLRMMATRDRQVAGALRMGPRALDVRLAFAGPALEAELDAPGAGSRGVTVRLDLPSGDGLLSALVPGAAALEFALRVTASSERGLTLGGASRRATVPARASTSGLDLRGLDLELRETAPPTLDIGATIAGDLIGADATLQGFGVTLVLDAAAPGGAALRVAAKPPDGVGLVLDLGPARGGGFLARQGPRYGGALQLSLGIAEVKAFGLLDPDAPGGLSLLLVLGATFTPPLELGLAFTLNAVGGLVGIQHVPDVEALAAGLRTRALDAVMFPRDVVREAPAILATLGRLFPQRAGTLVVGPLLRLGWGRPISFFTVDVGVLLSLPDPAITILGRLRVAAPAPELPIIDLKVDILGQITPERAWVLASLVDSRIAGFSVSGDFGFLADWSGDPTLALSAGGFHPRYQGPSALRGLRRISVDLSPPAGIGFRAEAYVAVTTGSVQFWALVQLYVEAGPVTAEGHLAFDAIVRWAPRFAFEIDLTAGVSVQFEGETFAGVGLSLHVEGPAPWRAWGHGEFTFIVKIPFDVGPITWGDQRNPPPPVVSPGRLVREQLIRPLSWRAVVPDGGDRFVQLAGAAEDPQDPSIPVHPLGAFEVRQTAVPLERQLARVGSSAVPADQRMVRLGTPTIEEEPASRTSVVEDLFPAGQFLDLTDDDKLSRPAFEPMPSGLRLVASGIQHGPAVQTTVAYETTFMPRAGGDIRLFDAVTLGGAVVTTLGAAGRTRLRAMDVRPRMASRQFSLSDPSTVTIRSTRDLGAAGHGLPATPMSRAEAERLVATAVGARPEAASAVQLVGLEVEA